MTRPFGAFVVACVVALAALSSAPAQACTACACGSAASLPMGAEVPWAGRLRAGVVVNTTGTSNSTALGRADVLGASVNGVLLWAPRRGLMVDVAVPLGARLQLHDGVAEGRGVGVGDIDVGARVVAQDRAFAPTWLGGLRLGARLPTTTWLRREDGQSRSRAIQPGLGELGLAAQLQGVFAPTRDITLVALVDGLLPLMSAYDSSRSGAAVDARTFGLLRANAVVSARLGLWARGTAAAHHDRVAAKAAALVDEARAAGGVEAGVVVDLSPEVQLGILSAVPVLSVGDVVEAPRLSASLLFDW